MNARELIPMIEDRVLLGAADGAIRKTILRALDLLARTEEGKVERFFLRNCYIEPKPSDFTPERPFDSIPGLDGYAIEERWDERADAEGLPRGCY